MKNIYIDGDNNPGICTQGIEYLNAEDYVKIFYASGNAYYASEKNRTKLMKNCEAKLEFIKMDSGKNSVDFAVAVEAALDIKSAVVGDVFLISGDRHFSSVAIALKRKIDNCPPIFCVRTIADAIASCAYQAESLKDVCDILCLKFGEDAGTAFYNRIDELQRIKFAKKCFFHKFPQK